MVAVLPVSDATSDGAGVEYRRRRPELSDFYQVVAENYRTLEAAADEGFIAPLPSFVKDEFEGFMSCGVLAGGFGFLQCQNPECREKLLAAFSCKGRAWCPSCLGRTMAETAANWTDHVLPSRAPLRQWVLTLPFELRARVAYDRELLGRITRLFTDSVLGFYHRTMRDLYRVGKGQSGAITVVQRVNSDLRLNPHLHLISLDGVFVETEDESLVFHRLPSLSNSDVADLLHAARVRILAFLARRGVVERDSQRDSELRLTDDGFAEREPELAALATAAVTGNPPAGPEQRQRPAIVLPDRGERAVSGLSAREDGFSVHAATTAPGDDARARETLCKYVLRPPLAQDRVRRLENGLVRILLKRAFSDGTTAIDLDPLSLLCRLAASVPPPRAHRVHYSGVLAAAHRWRPRVVPPPPPVDECASTTDDAHAHAHCRAEASTDARPATHRSRYRPWRELLKRTFKIDIEKCAKCGAPMLLRALVTAAETVTRFLRRLGEDPEPPPIAPARRPPFFTSPALRRRLGELDEIEGDSRRQMDMFDA